MCEHKRVPGGGSSKCPAGTEFSASEAQKELQCGWTRACEGVPADTWARASPRRALSTTVRVWGSQRGLGWKNSIVTQLYTQGHQDHSKEIVPKKVK